MDYLDPKKQFYHRLILMIGYVLVTIAIGIGTWVLLDQAYGYGLGKNGKVIQNGLVFISSQPNPAKISLTGRPDGNNTNTRLLLPAGVYQMKLTRPGYRVWQRTIGVMGASLTHYDYPILFPVQLTSPRVQNYTTAPGLVTQSPDRRWLLVEQPGSDTAFDLYDLKNPKRIPAATTITLPSSIVTKPLVSDSWQLNEWADDNQHILLTHVYDDKSEFVLVDRQNPAQSVNLNTTLNVNPTKLTLNNKKYNQYYVYDGAAGSLQTASLGSPIPQPLLTHVMTYQSYGSNSVLYATDADAPTGKVLVKLTVGDHNYVLHTFPANGTYLLDLTEYAGKLYVAAGDSSENKVYIYKDPIGQLNTQPQHAVVPTQVLHVVAPDYLSFSSNTQFIVAEHGNQFGVYDLEYKQGYNYTTTPPLDAPQVHAAWMDGDRLMYVSGGKVVVFDYDDANQQTLVNLSPDYLPVFSADYHYLFGIAPRANTTQFDLVKTPLLTPADQ
jgi:PEGA domain-containing protein